MSRSDTQVNIRLPAQVRDRIRERAAANRRSMNSEIVFYLDRALAAEENESPVAALTAPGPNTPPVPLAKEQRDELADR